MKPVDWTICVLGYPAFLVLLVVVNLSSGQIVTASDGDIAYYWVWQHYVVEKMLRGGDLLQLNAYIMSGTPFIAAMQSALFYPLNVMQYVLSVPTALNVQMLLHWWLALAGFHLLGRRLGWQAAPCCMAALVGAFSGWAVLHYWQGHAAFLMELTVAPWLIFAFLAWQMGSMRAAPYVLAVAALVAFQFSIGHPQIVYFTLLILAWMALGWLWVAHETKSVLRHGRDLLTTAAGVLLGFGLSAAQLLPVWLHARITVRGGAGTIPESYYTAHSMPWSNLPALVAPWVWGGWPGVDQYFGNESMWEVVGFVGASGFIVAILFFLRPRSLSRFQILAGSLAALGLLLALGEYSGLYHYLMKCVPGLGFFRNPGRALFISTFAAALLAGEGLERLRQMAHSERGAFLALLTRGWLLLGAAVALVLILFSDGSRSPIFMQMLLRRSSQAVVASLNREDVVRLFENFQVNLVGAGAVAAVTLALLSRLLWKRYATVASWGVVAVLTFELTQFARPYLVSFDPQRDEWSSRTVSFLHQNAARYRIASVRTPADLNQGMRWGIRNVWGYEASVPLRYATALAISQGRAHGFPEAWMNVERITPLINSLAVKYLIAPPKADLGRLGWHPVLDTIECSVHENPHALPRGYMVGNSAVMGSDEVLRFVNSSDFSPTSTVVLEAGDADAAVTTASLRSSLVAVTADEPERFAASAETDGQAWFVLMDQKLPGWRAELDGRPCHIYRANGVGMAVRIGPGKHVVQFSYREPGFRAGLTVSAASAFLYVCVLGLWLARRRRAA
jgi:hypothetical protein